MASVSTLQAVSEEAERNNGIVHEITCSLQCAVQVLKEEALKPVQIKLTEVKIDCAQFEFNVLANVFQTGMMKIITLVHVVLQLLNAPSSSQQLDGAVESVSLCLHSLAEIHRCMHSGAIYISNCSVSKVFPRMLKLNFSAGCTELLRDFSVCMDVVQVAFNRLMFKLKPKMFDSSENQFGREIRKGIAEEFCKTQPSTLFKWCVRSCRPVLRKRFLELGQQVFRVYPYQGIAGLYQQLIEVKTDLARWSPWIQVQEEPSAEPSDLLPLKIEYKDVLTGKLLGHGSFGSVLQCKWHDEDMVVKIIQLDFGAHELKKKFEMEVSILSSLQHPNLVRTFGFGYTEENGNGFIMMEQMEMDLSHLIKKMRKGGESHVFPIDVSIDLMLQIVEAMCSLREKRVIHRDLKSANILVNRLDKGTEPNEGFYQVKLADFGTSKMKDLSSSIFNTYRVGTPAYMAPEVNSAMMIGDEEIGNQACYSWKADVYSFGIICSEIISGKRPFQHLSVLNCRSVLAAVRQGDMPKVPLDGGDPLRRLIEDCWKFNPEDRPDVWKIRERLWGCRMYHFFKMERPTSWQTFCTRLDSRLARSFELEGRIFTSSKCWKFHNKLMNFVVTRGYKEDEDSEGYFSLISEFEVTRSDEVYLLSKDKHNDGKIFETPDKTFGNKSLGSFETPKESSTGDKSLGSFETSKTSTSKSLENFETFEKISIGKSLGSFKIFEKTSTSESLENFEILEKTSTNERLGSFGSPQKTSTDESLGSFGSPQKTSTNKSLGSFETPEKTSIGKSLGSFEIPEKASTGKSFGSFEIPKKSSIGKNLGSFETPEKASTVMILESLKAIEKSSTGKNFGSFETLEENSIGKNLGSFEILEENSNSKNLGSFETPEKTSGDKSLGSFETPKKTSTSKNVGSFETSEKTSTDESLKALEKISSYEDRYNNSRNIETPVKTSSSKSLESFDTRYSSKSPSKHSGPVRDMETGYWDTDRRSLRNIEHSKRNDEYKSRGPGAVTPEKTSGDKSLGSFETPKKTSTSKNVGSFETSEKTSTDESLKALEKISSYEDRYNNSRNIETPVKTSSSKSLESFDTRYSSKSPSKHSGPVRDMETGYWDTDRRSLRNIEHSKRNDEYKSRGPGAVTPEKTSGDKSLGSFETPKKTSTSKNVGSFETSEKTSTDESLKALEKISSYEDRYNNSRNIETPVKTSSSKSLESFDTRYSSKSPSKHSGPVRDMETGYWDTDRRSLRNIEHSKRNDEYKSRGPGAVTHNRVGMVTRPTAFSNTRQPLSRSSGDDIARYTSVSETGRNMKTRQSPSNDTTRHTVSSAARKNMTKRQNPIASQGTPSLLTINDVASLRRGEGVMVISDSSASPMSKEARFSNQGASLRKETSFSIKKLLKYVHM